MPRVKTIDYNDIYSIDTVEKILSNKYALITSYFEAQRLINHYYQYNLIETGDDNFSFMFGFPIRKSLNFKAKNKIIKM
jgi:hypothetical protein